MDRKPRSYRNPALFEPSLLADRAAFLDATDLISEHGPYAAMEAVARADRSRDQGNVLLFCRWRQAARAVAMVAGERVIGAIH
jgi:hypothetical protein